MDICTVRHDHGGTRSHHCNPIHGGVLLMRYVWTDAGDDPDFNVGNRHGIDGYYFPMFDDLTTRERLEDCKGRGYAVGLYIAWNWPQVKNSSPTEVASIMSEEYKRCYVAGLRMQYNDESHEPDKILTVLRAWRNLRSTVGTSWTMEGMQGGWMSKAFAAAVMNLKIRLAPQLYNGAMTQVWDSLAAQRDLTKRGFADLLISPFYDAAKLPHYWNGFAFTMGRLTP